MAWIDGLGQQPFFLFLNYMDAHSPYLPPAPHDGAFDAERPADPLHSDITPRLSYDRELRYLDAELTRLVDALRERGLFEDTVIVITSDHGEALGDRGIWKHTWTLYEDLVRVPLYVKPRGERRQRVHDSPVSGADVYGLALRALGLEPSPRVHGNGVFAERFLGQWYQLENVAAWSKTSGKNLHGDLVGWIDAERKLIVNSNGGVEAYDLARDPDETTPIELTPEQIRRARKRARAWWEAHPARAAGAPAALEKVDLERMRALGYADG